MPVHANDGTEITISSLQAWLDLLQPLTPIPPSYFRLTHGFAVQGDNQTHGSRRAVNQKLIEIHQIKKLTIFQLPTDEVQPLVETALEVREELFPNIAGPLFDSVTKVAYKPKGSVDPIDVAELKLFFRPRALCFDDTHGDFSDSQGIIMPTVLQHFDLSNVRDFAFHCDTHRCMPVTLCRGANNTLFVDAHPVRQPYRQVPLGGVYVTNQSTSHTTVKICGLSKGPNTGSNVSAKVRRDIEGAGGASFFQFGPAGPPPPGSLYTPQRLWRCWAAKNLKYQKEAQPGYCFACQWGCPCLQGDGRWCEEHSLEKGMGTQGIVKKLGRLTTRG